MQTQINIKNDASFKHLLSAVKKLSEQEKQVLKLQLFINDALVEMKAFELELKKKKQSIKKIDAEIVAVTTAYSY